MDDRALAQTLAVRARSTVQQKFSVDRMVDGQSLRGGGVIVESIIALIAGLLVGSFLNMCIFRMPRDLSVVRPRSFCPECEHLIAWYDNVPILSYFVLRRRCRHCGQLIPARYLIVETMTAALFFAVVTAFGPTAEAVKLCVLVTLLVGLTFADLEERILPDEFTLGGTAVGLVLAWFIPVNDVIPIARAIFSLQRIELSWRWMSGSQ